MEALALSLGVIPFLAGRTVLAVGLLATFFAVQGVLAQREATWEAVLLGIIGGFLSLGVQALAHWLRRLVDEVAGVLFRALPVRRGPGRGLRCRG